jgi:predicted protein tyrosine phosphatase
MRIDVASSAMVADGFAEGADAVVSIRATKPSDDGDLDWTIAQAVQGDLDGILVLRFDDIGIERDGVRTGPSISQIQDALDFARRHAGEGRRLVVQCTGGESRAPSLALVLISDMLGPGRETEAVSALARQDPEGRFAPNPRVVSLGDAALLRYGALVDAASVALPRFVAARRRWEKASLSGKPQKGKKPSRKRDRKIPVDADPWL